MTSEDLMKAMDDARFDPAGRAMAVMDAVDENLEGSYRMVDPTSPFMLMWEFAAAAGAHTLNGIDVMMRKRYPSLALTAEDIYLHMTDKDFLNIFTRPSSAPMTWLISRDEILRYAVEVTKGGMRKLVMPKNSNFTCDGVVFTLEYPIEFRIQPTGGLSVVYGAPGNGVLHEASGNLLQWDVGRKDNVPMVRVLGTVYQMAIKSQVYQLNSATIWNTRIQFSDFYHYCRAYRKVVEDGVAIWKPMKVTYTDQVFDPYNPTVLIKLYSNVIEARMPMVYQTTGQVAGEIRLDIYTTKGINGKVFDGFSANDWEDEFIDLDNEDGNKYTANWAKISTYSVYSDGYTTGAIPALTLEELRDRVMEHNLGEINLPITPVNLSRVLNDEGYQSVTDVDAITKRILNATRALPVPLDKYTVTPIAASVENLVVRLADLNGLDGVSHNGNIVTLHPSVLYKSVDGATTIVTTSEIQDLYQLKPEAMARAISAAGYRFSPFHWVLDATEESFAVRAYYLDTPEIKGRQFIFENSSLQLELQTAQTFTISRDPRGYLIHLITQSGKSYQDLDDDQVQVQIAYTPPGENSMAYLNGVLIAKQDGERVFEFLLETNYSIDKANALMLKNFSMFSDGVLDHQIVLDPTFDIIYTVSDYTVTDMEESQIDEAKNKSLLPYTAIGLLQERITASLGQPLQYLWTGSRTIVTPSDYQTYDHDVPRLYKEPVFEMDGDAIKVSVVDGRVVTTIIHQVGEPILEDGKPTYGPYAGDWVLDAEGNKILKTGRQLARQIDLTLFDGRYYFANDKSTTDYMAQICIKMIQWATNDMGATNKNTLEKTTMYFRPLVTTGTLNVVVESGASVTIDAEQALKVSVYMTEQGWSNEDLKANIRTSIIQSIADGFNLVTTATMNIIDEIKDNSGSEMLACRISGLGGAKNYPIVTMADDSGRMSLRKKLTALPDGTFTIEEDIDITFLKHLPSRASM